MRVAWGRRAGEGRGQERRRGGEELSSGTTWRRVAAVDSYARAVGERVSDVQGAARGGVSRPLHTLTLTICTTCDGDLRLCLCGALRDMRPGLSTAGYTVASLAVLPGGGGEGRSGTTECGGEVERERRWAAAQGVLAVHRSSPGVPWRASGVRRVEVWGQERVVLPPLVRRRSLAPLVRSMC